MLIKADAFQHLYNGSLPKHVASLSNRFHTMGMWEGSGNRVWSVLCCLAGWLARSHNRPLQPNPVASESTNQQTGDHTLPAPVVCARLSLIFLSAIVLIAVWIYGRFKAAYHCQRNTDVVIRSMFFCNESMPCSEGFCLSWMLVVSWTMCILFFLCLCCIGMRWVIS